MFAVMYSILRVEARKGDEKEINRVLNDMLLEASAYFKFNFSKMNLFRWIRFYIELYR